MQEDPYEQGRRAVLNLGHTFGHALELLSDYRPAPRRGGEHRHGGGGADWPAALGLCRRRAGGAHRRLPARGTACPRRSPHYAPEAIWEAMASDKKRQGGKLRFVLPRAIGDVVVTRRGAARSTVLGVLQAMREEAAHEPRYLVIHGPNLNLLGTREPASTAP